MVKMHKFEVRIIKDGKQGWSHLVEATDPSMAKRLALGIESGKAGNVGKKIKAGGYRKPD